MNLPWTSVSTRDKYLAPTSPVNHPTLLPPRGCSLPVFNGSTYLCLQRIPNCVITDPVSTLFTFAAAFFHSLVEFPTSSGTSRDPECRLVLARTLDIRQPGTSLVFSASWMIASGPCRATSSFRAPAFDSRCGYTIWCVTIANNCECRSPLGGFRVLDVVSCSVFFLITTCLSGLITRRKQSQNPM